MTPETWKEQAARDTRFRSLFATDMAAMEAASALYPLVQQAIAAERERCAKVIDATIEELQADNMGGTNRGAIELLEDEAAAIRSLKESDNAAG